MANQTNHARASMRSPALHWIDGEWLDSAKHTDSLDPATGEVLGTYADGGRDEAVKAVAAAVRAFKETDWKDNRALRSKVLHQLADRFEARREDLIHVLHRERQDRARGHLRGRHGTK